MEVGSLHMGGPSVMKAPTPNTEIVAILHKWKPVLMFLFKNCLGLQTDAFYFCFYCLGHLRKFSNIDEELLGSEYGAM